MRLSTIRPLIFSVLESEKDGQNSAEQALRRLSEVEKSIKASIDREAREKTSEVEQEASIARLIIAGLYAPEDSAMCHIAREYVSAEATMRAKSDTRTEG